MHLNPKSQRSEMDDEELTMMALEIMQDHNDPFGHNHNHYGHSHHTHNSHKIHNKQSVHKAYNIHINSPIEKSNDYIHSNHKKKISPNIPYQTQRQRQQHQQYLKHNNHQQQQQQQKEPSQTYSHLNPSYISDGIMANTQRSYSASTDDGDMVYVDYPRSIQGSGTRSGMLGISNLPSNDTNGMTISQLTQHIDDHKVNHKHHQSQHQYQNNQNQGHHLPVFELTLSQSQDISVDLDQNNDNLPQSHQLERISDDKITIVSQLSTNDSLRGEVLPPIPMTPNSHYNAHGQYQQYGQYPVSPNQLYDMIQNVNPNTVYAAPANSPNVNNIDETQAHHKNGTNDSKSTNRSSAGSKQSVANKYGNKKRGIKRFTKRQKTQSYHKTQQSQPIHGPHSMMIPTTNIMYSATYDQAVPLNYNIPPSAFNANPKYDSSSMSSNNHNPNIQPQPVRYVKPRKNKGNTPRNSSNNGSVPIQHRPKSVTTKQWRNQQNQRNGPLSIMSSPPRRNVPPNSVRYISVEDTTDHELENDVSLPSIRHIDISPSGSKLFAKRQNKNKNMPPKSPHTPPPKHTTQKLINLGDNTLSPKSVPVTAMTKDISHNTLSPKSPDPTHIRSNHHQSTSRSTLNAMSPVYSTGNGVNNKGNTTDSDNISPHPDSDMNTKPSPYSMIDTTPNISPFASLNKNKNKKRRKSHRSRSHFTSDNDHRNNRDNHKSMEQQSRNTDNVCMKPMKPHETNSVVSRSKSPATPRNHRKGKKSKKGKTKKSHKRRKGKLNKKKSKHKKFKSDGLQFIHKTVGAENTSTLPLAKLEKIGSRLSLSPTNSPNQKPEDEDTAPFVPSSRGPSFPAKQEFDHSGNAQKRKKKVQCICGSKLTKIKCNVEDGVYCSKCGHECDIDSIIYRCKSKQHQNGYNLCMKCVKKQKKKSKAKSKKLKQKKGKTRKYRSDELYKIDRNYHNEPVLPPSIPFLPQNTSKSDEVGQHGHKHGHNKHVPTKKKVHTLTVEHNTDQFTVKSKTPNNMKMNPMPMSKAGSGSGSSGRTSTGSPRQPVPYFVKRGPVPTNGFGQVNPFRSAQSQPPMSTYLGDLEDDIIRSPKETLQQQMNAMNIIKQDHSLRITAHNNKNNIDHHDRRSNNSRHSHGHRHNHKHAQNKRQKEKDHDHIKSLTVASPICLTGNEFTFRADYESSNSRQSQPPLPQQAQTARKHKKSHKHSNRGYSNERERKLKHSTKSKQKKEVKKKQTQSHQTLLHNPIGYYSKNIDPNNPFSPSFSTRRVAHKNADTNVIEYNDNNSNMDEPSAFNFPEPGQTWNPGHKQISSRKSKKNKHSKRHQNMSITPSPQKPNKKERGHLGNERYGKRNRKYNQRSKTPRPTRLRKSKSPSRRANDKAKRKRSNSIAASSNFTDNNDVTDNEYAIETEDGFIFVARSEYENDMGL